MKNSKMFLVAALVLTAAGVFAGHGAVPAYPNFGLPRVEEMMFLVLQVGVILFAARMGGALAGKIKLPSIIGELAAGIVIGPWALGGIGFGDGIFEYGLFHGAALREMHLVDVSGEGFEQLKHMFGTVGKNSQPRNESCFAVDFRRRLSGALRYRHARIGDTAFPFRAGDEP